MSNESERTPMQVRLTRAGEKIKAVLDNRPKSLAELKTRLDTIRQGRTERRFERHEADIAHHVAEAERFLAEQKEKSDNT